MTGEPSRHEREDESNASYGIFGGFNDAYATSILEGDAESLSHSKINNIETDFEYHGILLDPDFEVSFDPDFYPVIDPPTQEGMEADSSTVDEAETDGELLGDEVFTETEAVDPPRDTNVNSAIEGADDHTETGDDESEEPSELAELVDADLPREEPDGDTQLEEPVTDLDPDSVEDDSTIDAEVSAVESALATQPDQQSPTVPVDQIVRVERLIAAIRDDGHHASNIDPLGLMPRTAEHLCPESFGILPDTLAASSRFLADVNDELRLWLANSTIGEAIDELMSFYCGNIGSSSDIFTALKSGYGYKTKSKTKSQRNS